MTALSPHTITPVIIAHPAPFRFIQRDANDVLKITLKEVNSSSYNYVKLHRATKFFDADIVKPFPLCVTFDGGFILPFTKEYGSLDTALDEFNRIFASILIGGIYIQSVSPTDLAQGEMTLKGYYRHSRTFGLVGEQYKALGERDAGTAANMGLMEPPHILASEIEQAYTVGSKLLRYIPSLSPSLFITSFTYYLSNQFRESLTHAWISIEQIIENVWSETISNKADVKNISGRKKFLESSQWTAAHKIDVLYQKELVDESLYEKLNSARQARNNFIHRGDRPETVHAQNAISALIKLLQLSAKLHSVDFNSENLEKYLNPAETGPSGYYIGKAGNVDWSRVSHWKPIKIIPGDEQWEGDFESFDDITLKDIRGHQTN